MYKLRKFRNFLRNYVYAASIQTSKLCSNTPPANFNMEPKNHPIEKENHLAGQIIATSHDLTPNGGLVREIPLFQGNLGWWNIIIWPDLASRQREFSTLWFGFSGGGPYSVEAAGRVNSVFYAGLAGSWLGQVPGSSRFMKNGWNMWAMIKKPIVV